MVWLREARVRGEGARVPARSCAGLRRVPHRVHPDYGAWEQVLGVADGVYPDYRAWEQTLTGSDAFSTRLSSLRAPWDPASLLSSRVTGTIGARGRDVLLPTSTIGPRAAIHPSQHPGPCLTRYASRVASQPSSPSSVPAGSLVASMPRQDLTLRLQRPPTGGATSCLNHTWRTANCSMSVR